MCGGAALGHLSLCCKDSSWISCVAALGEFCYLFRNFKPHHMAAAHKSRHILMLFLLSDGHHPTAVLLHPQHKKKYLKALRLWASLHWSLFRQTGQKMHVKQIRRNVWVHSSETDLFSKYKRGFLSLLAHTFQKCYTAGTLILRLLCSSSWRIKGCLLEYIFLSKKVVIIRECWLYKPLAEGAHMQSGNLLSLRSLVGDVSSLK